MTSTLDNDAFERRFEEAVNSMHGRTPGGGEPAAGFWTTIRAQMGDTSRAETADPRAMCPDPVVVDSTTERKQLMATVLTPPIGETLSTPRKRLGWMTLLAAGLAGIMIFTSLWMNTGTAPPNNHQNLAWAPGMGTPVSSPVVEYGCNVEPLTEEEAVQIILNPFTESLRLQGDETQQPPLTEYMEWGEPDLGLWHSGDIPIAADAEARDEAVAAANQFWECLATGSTLQVWALMAPQTVQYEVILKFPVIRSEQDIRDYVAEVGQKQYRYIEGRFGFGPPAWTDPRDGMRVADTENWDVLVSELNQFAAGRYATVSMLPVEGNMLAPGVNQDLYLQQFPNGEWRVVGSGPPFPGKQ